MDLSYDEIRRIHRLEKNTSSLAEVSSEFYEDLQVFLGEERQKYLDSLKNFSVSKTRDFTNLKKMVEEVFSMREKKILNKALVASRTKEVSENNMTEQEKKIFHRLLDLLSSHNELLTGLFETGAVSSRVKSALSDEMELKILQDVPSFVGYDMKEYGPFEKGKLVKVPVKIGKLLDSRKLAAVAGQE